MKKKFKRNRIQLVCTLVLSRGALYVRDEKFGNTEEILKQLQRYYLDVNFLSRKTLGYISGEQDFKSICVFYKTKLMK